jgi:hypothetical protein
MAKDLNIDSGNNPTKGKRVLFFITRDDGQGVDGWPAKILDHFGSVKKAPTDDPDFKINAFCNDTTTKAFGQTVCLLKVETAGSDHRVEAYADSGRSAGTFDEYKDGDLRV